MDKTYLFMVVLLLLFLPFLGGAVILVKDSDTLQCITNQNTGLAWKLKTSKDAEYVEQDSSSWTFITNNADLKQLECHPGDQNSCKNWKGAQVIFNTDIEKNDFNLGPINDYRWNMLQMNATSGDEIFNITHKIGSLVENKTAYFHISILAEDNGYIYLSEGNNPAPNKDRTYWIILDGWKPYLQSAIRKCPHGSNNDDTNCKKLHSTYTNKAVLNDGNIWVDVTLELEKYIYYHTQEQKYENALRITVLSGDKQILNFDSKFNIFDVTNLVFRTYESKRGYWKLHKYKMISPKKGKTISSPEISISQEKFLCLSVIYFSDMDAELKILGSVPSTSYELPGGKLWQVKRLSIKVMPPIIKLQFNFLESNNFYIGDVRICDKNEKFISTIKPNMKTDHAYECQELKSKIKTAINLNGKTYQNTENLPTNNREYCKLKDKSSCKGIVACATNSCSCFPGFHSASKNPTLSNLCNLECDGDTFGANCKDKCGYCFQKKSCDKISGYCSKGCEEEYKKPLCKEKLSILPLVYISWTTTNYKEIFIDIKKSSKLLANGNKELLPQFREQGYLPWYNGSTSQFLSPQTLIIRNVKGKTQYQVRVIILEQDGQGYFGTNVPSKSITTKCTYTDSSSIQLIYINSSTVNFTWEISEESCPSEEYHLGIEGFDDEVFPQSNEPFILINNLKLESEVYNASLFYGHDETFITSIIIKNKNTSIVYIVLVIILILVLIGAIIIGVIYWKRRNNSEGGFEANLEARKAENENEYAIADASDDVYDYAVFQPNQQSQLPLSERGRDKEMHYENIRNAN